MSIKEKKLLIVMLAIIALGLVFKGIPFAYEKYKQRQNDIKILKDKKHRVKHLIRIKDFWQLEHKKSIKQKALLEKELFSANSNELVAAKMQSVIKDLASQSGIRIASMRLAEFQQSGDWLLVSLSVTINTNSDTDKVINLLHKIGINKQKIIIKEINIRSSRNLLNGTITLVGFSKIAEKTYDEKEDS